MLSDQLYAPTRISCQNLLHEGIAREKITVTGKYGCRCGDAEYQDCTATRCTRWETLALNLPDISSSPPTGPRTWMTPSRLAEILTGLRKVSAQFGLPVVFPMHPRTQKMVREFSLSTEGIRVMDPVGYLEFLVLESNAALILTDSGGVQEEGCILSVPCVTLRENTERPETIDAGANILPGPSRRRFLRQ